MKKDYRAKLEELKRGMAADATGGTDTVRLAEAQYRGILNYQLAMAQKLFGQGVMTEEEVQTKLLRPFVLGYLFGVAAFLIEHHRVDRASREANDIIVGVHSEAFDETRLPGALDASRGYGITQDSLFGAGMTKGADDIRLVIAYSDSPAVGLLQYLFQDKVEAVCELHAAPMELRRLSPRLGFVSYDSEVLKAYSAARKLYPNAMPLMTPRAKEGERYVEVLFCSECESATQSWLDGHVEGHKEMRELFSEITYNRPDEE